MAWTFCTSGAAIARAGHHVNSTIVDYGASKTKMDEFSDQAEGRINTDCHTDFLTGSYNFLSGALSAASATLIGMNFINYDPAGYASLREANLMINVLDSEYKAIIATIKLKVNQRAST